MNPNSDNLEDELNMITPGEKNINTEVVLNISSNSNPFKALESDQRDKLPIVENSIRPPSRDKKTLIVSSPDVGMRDIRKCPKYSNPLLIRLSGSLKHYEDAKSECINKLGTQGSHITPHPSCVSVSLENEMQINIQKKLIILDTTSGHTKGSHNTHNHNPEYKINMKENKCNPCECDNRKISCCSII